MNRKHILPTVAAALVVGLVLTAVRLAGALGRIDVLLEQAETAEAVTEAAEIATVEAVAALNAGFEVAEVERVEAAEALAEAQEEIDSQEAEAEAAFRRAEALAEDNPVLERAIQEMRAEAIVTSMEHEEKEAISAVALFAAQQRIRTLERLSGEVEESFDMERAAWSAERAIKDQIIAEQQNALAPSFITKLFDMPEVAAFGAIVGGGLTYAATR